MPTEAMPRGDLDLRLAVITARHDRLRLRRLARAKLLRHHRAALTGRAKRAARAALRDADRSKNLRALRKRRYRLQARLRSMTKTLARLASDHRVKARHGPACPCYDCLFGKPDITARQPRPGRTGRLVRA